MMTIPTGEQLFSKTEMGKPDVAFLKNHFYREGRIEEDHALYSGLKNRCNVWQFWSGCDVVLDRVRIMLSVGGVK